MKYFPLGSDRFEHPFGVRALANSETLVEATDLYDRELELKRRLLDENPEHYFQSLAGSELAHREVFDLLSSNAPFLHGGINALTGEAVAEDHPSPLLSIARHLQEDLAIMSDDATAGFPLVAGVICFPSGWCIGDKIGKSVWQIHQPVPEFDSQLAPATGRLLDRLKPGRGVWRTNWGVRPSDQLDQSPIHAEFLAEQRDRITPSNAGSCCFFRVERQTLARLPKSGHILFAIHTHQCRLDQLSGEQQRILLGVIDSCPEDTLTYKGILSMRDAITSYLRR